MEHLSHCGAHKAVKCIDFLLFETLKEHVKSEVGAWKYPRWIEFVDALPKTATGKIQRFKLRDAES